MSGASPAVLYIAARRVEQGVRAGLVASLGTVAEDGRGANVSSAQFRLGA